MQSKGEVTEITRPLSLGQDLDQSGQGLYVGLRNGKTPRTFDCLRHGDAVYKRSIHFDIYAISETPVPTDT